MNNSNRSSSLRIRLFAPIETFLSQNTWAVTLILIVVLFAFFAILIPEKFISNLPISNIFGLRASLGIIVLGVAVLMIAGEFDLSIGSAVAAVGFVFLLVMNWFAGGVADNIAASSPGFSSTWNTLYPWLAALVALAMGVLLGLFNGSVVVLSGNPSFIITLGTLLFFRGIARFIGGGTGIKFESQDTPILFQVFRTPIEFVNNIGPSESGGSTSFIDNFFFLPGNWHTGTLWFIALTVIIGVFLHRTNTGNWIFASGGNVDTAKANGVPTRRIKLTAFALVGLMVGIAALVNLSESPSIDPGRGVRWELYAVAACVMGGLRLKGGFGTILGAALGLIMISTLEQGFRLLGLGSLELYAAFGALLIVIAALNQYLSKSDK